MIALKYIFIDVDGTLINDNKEVSLATLKELKRVTTEYDAKIFLVSSRPPKSIDLLWEKMGMSGGTVGFNGTIIKWKDDYIEHKKSNFTLLPQDLIEELFVQISQDDVSFNLYTADKWYVNNINYWTKREIRSTGLTPEPDKLESIIKEKNTKIHKILIRSEESKMKDLLKILKILKIQTLSRLTLVKPTLVELTPLGIDKGLAMETILKKFNDSMEYTIAFGDGENDSEMIRLAKVGVVMNNAVALLKKDADFITLSNNQDGVASAIKKYFP